MMTEKILLIDDDTDDQQFFTDVMGSIDSRIVCEIAGNGLEGMELLNNGSVPDMIFLDLNMPYMNGFDFLRAFRENEHWNGIPVVIFTTSDQQRDIELSKQLGAQAFLTKPNTVRDLRISIERLMQSNLTGISQQMRIF